MRHVFFTCMERCILFDGLIHIAHKLLVNASFCSGFSNTRVFVRLLLYSTCNQPEEGILLMWLHICLAIFVSFSSQIVPKDECVRMGLHDFAPFTSVRKLQQMLVKSSFHMLMEKYGCDQESLGCNMKHSLKSSKHYSSHRLIV